MKPRQRTVTASVLLALAWPLGAVAADRVDIANGPVVGTTAPSGIHVYKGIPFAEPPVGDLRFQPPQPVKNWKGERAADKFGPRCMQRQVFGDMGFRSNGMTEDCLYLNVWTPARSAKDRLPVLVYFYGGGFIAGDGSEPRYDGEAMARMGIVTLTVNYRLGVFGFLAHPELTKESSHRASGNEGLLDQTAALLWVQQNVAAFGGDPKHVTIAGESAGSVSVSAQMASPLAKHLIAGAIGESGALINTLAAVPLAEGEENGVKFATAVGAPSLAALRAMPADALLEATAKPGLPRFSPTLDGYFLSKQPAEVFAAGEQAHVPLLAGWNSEENNQRAILGPNEPTPESYAKAVRGLYGDRADEVLKAYPGTTNEEVVQSATDLASDRFIAYGTWKWCDLHSRTSGGSPVYRYYYAHPRPAMNPKMGNAVANLAGGVTRSADAAVAPPPRPRGAVHSADIEYVMGNLATNEVYAWTPDDYKMSAVFQGYVANFVKTGNPNGPSLPPWPPSRADGPQFLRLDVDSRAEPDSHRERYLLLDQLFAKK